MIVVNFLAVVIIGYLLGSIPSGLLIGKWLGKVDIRAFGSGKTGTTNVLRSVGKKGAVLALVMDLLKGALAVLAAGLLVAQSLAALAAIAGHNWSIFLKFKGGRGVATFFGGLLALCPVAALFGGEVFIIGAGTTRFASLGSIAGAIGTYSILIPLTIIYGFPLEYIVYAFIGTMVIVIMHKDNINRLMAGKERRIGQKAEALTPPPVSVTEEVIPEA